MHFFAEDVPVLDHHAMDRDVMFELCFDRKHGDKHDEPFGVFEFAPSFSIPLWIRKLRCFKELLKPMLGFPDPVRVEPWG